jgi:ATP-binding cassette, subfamily G (WHITE), member 2, SNQ2
VYVTNFWIQIKTLLVREFQLIGGDKGAIFGKVFAVLSKAFIYATAFLFLKEDSAGAFSRGGCLFISVLFNSLVYSFFLIVFICYANNQAGFFV